MKVSNIIVLLWWKYDIKTLNKSIHNRPALSLLWFVLFIHRCQILYCEWLCTLCRNYKIVIQFNSHANTHMHTQMDERKFQYKRWGDFCCASPCSSQAKELGLSAWQHVSPCIRWTSEQWFQPGAGGGYLKLWEKGVHEWLCSSACVCVTEGERETGLSAIWSIGTIPDEAENLCHFYQFTDCSLSWMQTLFREDPVVPGYASSDGTHQFWKCEMSHYKVCSSTNSPHHPDPKWIDPKWDQQAKSSLFIECLLQTD